MPIRSAIAACTVMSWVTNMIDEPMRSWMPLISASTSCCTSTSSAVVGSSAMMNSGSQTVASAMVSRWRMPPESWCG